MFAFMLTILKSAYSQMPAYNGYPSAEATNQSQNRPAQTSSPQAESRNTQASETQTATQSQNVNNFGINRFDPYIDNHLRAPEPSDKTGLFGHPIKSVEELLKNYGAKSYSYAFGKYSRMKLSAYMITLYFDREKRLGGVSIEPRPPYKFMGPDAREFFKNLFGRNIDMSKFQSVVSATRFEMKYIPR